MSKHTQKLNGSRVGQVNDIFVKMYVGKQRWEGSAEEKFGPVLRRINHLHQKEKTKFICLTNTWIFICMFFVCKMHEMIMAAPEMLNVSVFIQAQYTQGRCRIDLCSKKSVWWFGCSSLLIWNGHEGEKCQWCIFKLQEKSYAHMSLGGCQTKSETTPW